MKRMLLLLLSTLPLCFAEETGRNPVFFPLQNLSWWEYSGTAKLKGNPRTEAFKMRMEVVEVIERGGVRAAWVRGNPLGLNDYSVGPGDQVIARVGHKMYVTDTARSAEVRSRMENKSDTLKDLFHDNEFLVDTTMPAGPGGSMIGDDYQVTHSGKNGFRTIRFKTGIGIVEYRFADTSSGDSGYMKLDASDVQPETPSN